MSTSRRRFTACSIAVFCIAAAAFAGWISATLTLRYSLSSGNAGPSIDLRGHFDFSEPILYRYVPTALAVDNSAEPIPYTQQELIIAPETRESFVIEHMLRDSSFVQAARTAGFPVRVFDFVPTDPRTQSASATQSVSVLRQETASGWVELLSSWYGYGILRTSYGDEIKLHGIDLFYFLFMFRQH